MKYGLALFARFGLFSRKPAATQDQFDLRLEKSRARENRNEARPVLFKNRQLHQEA